MSDPLAFYEVGCEPSRGVRGGIVAIRRLLRRVQRPAFQRLVAILRALCDRLDGTDQHIVNLNARVAAQAGLIEAQTRRIDALSDQLETASALGWDQVALARRLAAIEDQLDSSGQDGETTTSSPIPAAYLHNYQ